MNWLKLLDRIGEKKRETTLETLQHLQERALLTLPFENLDIHLGRPICLDHRAVYSKIVVGDRGGFCYELNECLYMCLAAMGFEVHRLEARVTLGGPGEPFDHQVTLVLIDGVRWLTDIGFGDSALTPLNLDSSSTQSDGKTSFRFSEQDGRLELHRLLNSDEWTRVLAINSEPQLWSNFEESCHWTQTSPDSAFVHKRLCTMALPNGRVSLSGNSVKETGENNSEVRIHEADYTTVLAQRFGIALNSPCWRRPFD